MVQTCIESKRTPLRYLLPASWFVVFWIVNSNSPGVSATDEPEQSGIPVAAGFDSPISAAIQDIHTLDVFATVPSERHIQRFTANQLPTADTRPAASGKLNGEPQRIILRSIGESRYVFVQCVNPSVLVQLDAISLKTVREIPLATSAVSDMFGSEANDDPYVWLIIDDKPPESRSPIRRWKLAVVNFSVDSPAVTMLQPCIGAIVTPDGKSLLVSASGRGAVRMTIAASDKPAPTLTLRPTETQLETIQLRRGCFFSPSGDALVTAGQQVVLDGSTDKTENADTTKTQGQETATSIGTIVSYLRSAPVAVVQAAGKLDDGTATSQVQFIDAVSGRSVSTLSSDIAPAAGRGGQDWWIFEVPDNKGLLYCTASDVRFLPTTALPVELVESLNAPAMTLQSNPDLTFRIGEAKEVALLPTDERCAVTLASGPEGMTFNEGTIRWQPTITQQGMYDVEVEIAAGSRTRTISLKARAGFDVQKLPASYDLFAYSSSLRLLAGAISKSDRTVGVEILREDEHGNFELLHWIQLPIPADDLAFASMDGTSGLLLIRSHMQNKLNLIDPVAGTKIGDLTAPVSRITSFTVGENSKRSLVAYCGPKGNQQVMTAGLFDLKSLTDRGTLHIEPSDGDLQADRIFVRADRVKTISERIAISHAAISSDGETLHLITHPLSGTTTSQYSEWTIPEETNEQTFELTCRYRIDLSEHSRQLENSTLISGFNGFAALQSTLFAFGESVRLREEPTKPLHFVPNLPFLVRWNQQTPDATSVAKNTVNSMKTSVVSLNTLTPVTAEFSISLESKIPHRISPNNLLCTSNSEKKILIFAHGDALTRVPYSSIGIDEQSFEPAALIEGPRTLQAGSTYEFPIELFPSTAKVTIEKSPAGVTLEDGRLKWDVAADSTEQESISLSITDDGKSKVKELQFSIAAAIPVNLNERILRYTFDRESGLLAGIDGANNNIVLYDIKQLQAGNGNPLRTLTLEEPPAIVELKRVDNKSCLIVVSRDTRRAQIIDADSGEIRFDLAGKTLKGVTDVVVSPDPGVPFAAVNAGDPRARDAGWQLINLKTGEADRVHMNQRFIAFSPSGKSLAVNDPRISGGVVITNLNETAESMTPVLTHVESHFQPNPEIRRDCAVDFLFRRIHQNGTVHTARIGAASPATQPDPIVFFNRSPFYLSLKADANGNRNRNLRNDTLETVTLTAVSRNTLKPVGQSVELKIPAGNLRTSGSHLPTSIQVFLTSDEQTAIVVCPQVCFAVPVARFRIPDEVALALTTTDARFTVGSESVIDLQPVDPRATLTIASIPEGMTFEQNTLKWKPQPFDCGSRSLIANIKAGDLERTETISVRVSLPSMRVPFSVVGMSAEPDRNQVFLYGTTTIGNNGEKQCPVGVVDLTTRKVLAESMIAAEKLQMAVFDGDRIILVQANGNAQELVVIKAEDFSVIARVPLSIAAHQMALLRKENALLLAQHNRIARYSLPDLKSSDPVQTVNTVSLASIPVNLNLRGATQGPLSLNWDGSKRLWRVTGNNNIGLPQIQLQGDLQAIETEAASAFTSTEIRIAHANVTPTFLQQPFANSSMRQSINLRSDNRGNAARTMLSVSNVSAPLTRMFPAATSASPSDPSENNGAAVPDAESILLTDQINPNGLGVVAATNDQALAAVGNELWTVRFDGLKLQTSESIQRPEFVRQQSHFLLTGSEKTQLVHKVRNGNEKTRFAMSTRTTGVSLDATTGDVTIDHKAIADEIILNLTRGLQSVRNQRGEQSFDAERITQLNGNRATSMIQHVLPPGDPVPEGMPILMPIEVVLLDDGQPVDALGYTVALFVTADTLNAGIDNWRSKHTKSTPQGDSPAGSEIEQLREIVDKLEARLKRAETLLREKGIEIPP